MFARVWTLKEPRQSRGTYCQGDANMTTQAIRGLEEANPISALSHRGFFLTAAAVGGFALAPDAARAAIVRTDIASLPPYGNGTLPAASRSPTPPHRKGQTRQTRDAALTDT